LNPLKAIGSHENQMQRHGRHECHGGLIARHRDDLEELKRAAIAILRIRNPKSRTRSASAPFRSLSTEPIQEIKVHDHGRRRRQTIEKKGQNLRRAFNSTCALPAARRTNSLFSTVAKPDSGLSLHAKDTGGRRPRGRSSRRAEHQQTVGQPAGSLRDCGRAA